MSVCVLDDDHPHGDQWHVVDRGVSCGACRPCRKSASTAQSARHRTIEWTAELFANRRARVVSCAMFSSRLVGSDRPYLRYRVPV